MKDIHSIVIKPLVTEKSTNLQNDHNKYTFKINLHANKYEVKAAVEELFKVKVLKVRTLICHGKRVRVGKQSGFKADWKKAVVTLKEGNSIELFEGA